MIGILKNFTKIGIIIILLGLFSILHVERDSAEFFISLFALISGAIVVVGSFLFSLYIAKRKFKN